MYNRNLEDETSRKHSIPVGFTAVFGYSCGGIYLSRGIWYITFALVVLSIEYD